MRRINAMSILDCFEEDQAEKHREETDKIFEKIYSMRNYDCEYVVKYVDEYHKDHREVFKLHDDLNRLDDILEGCDFKNGIDSYIDKDGNLAFMVHGQGYEYQGENYLVETLVTVKAFDNHGYQVNMSKTFLGKEKKQDEFSL